MFRRLGQIEQHLGSRLFERGRAGYALTPCGTEMVDLAERMFQEIVGFERRVTGQDLRPSGELRITASDVLLRHLLSAVFVAFRRVYPEIILDIVVSNQRLNLTKRDADVAVRAAYQSPEPLAGAKVARIGSRPRREAPDWCCCRAISAPRCRGGRSSLRRCPIWNPSFG